MKYQERCPQCASLMACVGVDKQQRRVLTCYASITAVEHAVTTMIPCNPRQRLMIDGEWVRGEDIKWFQERR